MMLKLFGAVISGVIFGLGLIVSEMVNPAKVLAFLDVAGHWDATLAWVMAGALGTLALLRQLIVHQSGPVPAATSANRAIDRNLIFGAAIFGLGWGLVGFCPGPALVALGYGEPSVYVFVAGMFAGFVLFNFVFPPK